MVRKDFRIFQNIFIFVVPLLCSGVNSNINSLEIVGSEIVGEGRCVVDGEAKVLVLTQEEFDPKIKQQLYRRLVIFKLKRYALIGDRRQDQPEQTVWQEYSYYIPAAVPRPIWDADFKANDASTIVYLVLSSWSGSLFSSTLYAIDPRRPSTSGLAEFTENGHLVNIPKDYREKRLSEFKKEFALRDCAINGVGLVVKRDYLLLQINREEDECHHISFRYSLRTKEWSAAH